MEQKDMYCHLIVEAKREDIYISTYSDCDGEYLSQALGALLESLGLGNKEEELYNVLSAAALYAKDFAKEKAEEKVGVLS